MKKPTRERRVGPEFVGYPHAGARLQEQQHGAEKTRIAIEYAAVGGASNAAELAKSLRVLSRLVIRSSPFLGHSEASTLRISPIIQVCVPVLLIRLWVAFALFRAGETTQPKKISAAFGAPAKSNVHDASRFSDPPA